MTHDRARTLLRWLLAAGVLYRIAYLADLSTLPAWTHARGDELYYLEAARTFESTCEPFHMSPLYVSWLAALFAVFGTGPLVWRLPQVAMGVASAWLLGDVARRRSGERAGLWVTGLYLFCGPLLFYESNLAVATFASAAMVAALYCLQRWSGGGSSGLRWWIGASVAVGIGTIARPNAVLLLAPIVLLPWVARRTAALRRKLLLSVAAPAVVLAVIAPVTIHNARCGDEIVWVTDTGGMNFYVGNHRDANGVFNVPPAVEGARSVSSQDRAFVEVAQRELGRPLSRAEASRYWRDRALDEIAADPGRWLALLGTKLALLLNAEEFSNTRSYAFRGELMFSLGPWLVQIGYLVPFALLGAAVWLKAPARHLLPLGFTAAYVVAHLGFFVLGHYRQVLIPLWILAAVDGGTWLVAQIRARHRSTTAAGLAVLVAGSVFTRWSILEAPRADEAFKHAYALHQRGDLAEAERWYQEALAERPDHPSARRNLAILYSRAGDHERARLLWEAILRDAKAAGDNQRVAEARHFLALGRQAGPATAAPDQ